MRLYKKMYIMIGEEGLFDQRYRSGSARLGGYDYGANGMYFITICTKDRQHFFGEIHGSEPVFQPTQIGQIAVDCWYAIPEYFPFVMTDALQLMPNHLHAVLWIDKDDPASWQPGQFGPQRENLAAVIRGFKAGVTKQARARHLEFGWQPRYYDRVVRNDDELNRIRTYIANNPVNWRTDHENQEGLFM